MVIFVCKCIKKIPNYTQSILQFLHFPKNLLKEPFECNLRSYLQKNRISVVGVYVSYYYYIDGNVFLQALFFFVFHQVEFLFLLKNYFV